MKDCAENRPQRSLITEPPAARENADDDARLRTRADAASSWGRAGATPSPPPTETVAALLDERDDEQGHDVDDLDHRVDGGTRRVFIRVADRVAGDGRGMGV
jgi:hypothetical protein